jgi:hypothetical protein
VIAGVEEDDLDAGHHRGGEVRDHPVAHARSGDELLAEGVRGPADDLVGGGALQQPVAVVGDLTQGLGVERRREDGGHR